jgi:hypothetical protein
MGQCKHGISEAQCAMCKDLKARLFPKGGPVYVPIRRRRTAEEKFEAKKESK